jgi:DNA-binding beta-propeller fold protein YncE
MEIKRRMRIRLTWIVAILALVAIGFLLSCSTKYSSSSNGLVVVPSQGSAVMETFSINLANGEASQINNVNGPPTPGLPTSVILNPAGTFAYVIMKQSAALVPSVTGIGVFPIGSNGKLGPATTSILAPILSTTVNCIFVQNGMTVTQEITVPVTAPVVPTAMTMDSAGKFLFVADVATSAQGTYTCNGATITADIPVQGAVSVFTVSSGTLNEVPGSPFALPAEPGGSTPSASALAVTPTIYPVRYSYCSGHAAPTTENLYVTDSVNYVLLNYSVDLSTGALGPMPYSSTEPGIPTGEVPSGVAVDPCNRFAYVANALTNNVSAYTICSAVSLLSTPPCPNADFSLHAVAGLPYPAGDVPGPMAVDAYGKFLYVVNTGSGNISGYVISSSTGALTPFLGLPAAAGSGANSIAIRSDDSWVFVADTNATSVSQYAISLTTGFLSPVGPISTLDYPSGVAVK